MKKPCKPMSCCATAWCAFVVLGLSQAVHAEPRAEDFSSFKQLFGEKIEAVQRTRGTDDDAELLEEMKESAASIPDSPEVQRLIYRSMIDVATASRHYVLAVSAIDLLKDRFPADPAADEDQAIALLEKGYRSSRRDDRKSVGEAYLARLLKRTDALALEGRLDTAAAEYRRARLIARDIDSPSFDSIQKSIDRIDRRARTESKIEDLKAVLAKDPGNAAVAEELTLLMMIDKNSPAQAVGYVEATRNAGLIAVVRLAAEDAAALEADESLRVAEWYIRQSQAGSHDDAVLHSLLSAAVAYCDLTLEQYTQRDAKRLRIAELRSDAAKQLAGLDSPGETAGAAAQWVDLLKRYDPQRHSLGDGVEFSDGKLSSKESDFILEVSPDAGYDLKMRFTFVEGKDGLNFSLPIGKSHFSLSYSRSKHTRINLKGAGAIDTKKYMLRPGQQAELLIRLRRVGNRRAAVQLALNGTVIIDWKGEATKLESNADFQTPDQFGRSVRVTCGGHFIFSDIQYMEAEDN